MRGEKGDGRETRITRMQSPLPSRDRCPGFTITELLVAVVIVAILVAVALPTFLESFARSRRSDAQVALGGLVAALERHYSSQPSFSATYATAATGITADNCNPCGAPKATIFPSKAPLDGATKFYDLTISTADKAGFTVVATRINPGAQANDRCGDFTLTSTGVRGVTNARAGVTWQDCWR